MKDIDICKCGHEKAEHNPPSTWEEDDDTFCFHKGCKCEKYEEDNGNEIKNDR